MNKTGFAASQGDLSKGFGDLVDQGTQFGMAILGQMVSSSAQIFGGIFQSLASSQASNCCCEIPPPCWEPNRLGEVTSLACPAGTATVLLRVTNCNTRGSKVQVRTTGQDAGVTITPNELALGPMERGVAAVSLILPANAGTGDRREVLIWLHGCKNHFLRWTIEVTTKNAGVCTREVAVDDCPDYLHHWYDHFYCHRHCLDQDKRG